MEVIIITWVIFGLLSAALASNPHSALPEGWKIITDLAPEEDSSSGKQG